MSGKIDDGGPAFPQPNHVIDGDNGRVEAAGWMSESGMTLRDYFAAHVLTGLIAYPGDNLQGDTPDEQAKDAAEKSYAMADAMLAARKGKS